MRNRVLLVLLGGYIGSITGTILLVLNQRHQ